MDNPNLSNQVPPTNNQAGGFQVDSLTKDPKFMETVKTFAIYGAILSVVRMIVGSLSASLFSHSIISANIIPALITTAIFSLVFGAIGGVVFYYVFGWVRDFVKGSSFLSKYINSMFTLFWIPTLVVTVIMGALGLLSAMSAPFIIQGIVMVMIVSLIVNIVLYYFYAKAVSAKLQNYYPW